MMLQQLRQHALPIVDDLLEPLGLYAAYELGEREFVGDVWLPLGAYDAEQYLLENGYEPSTLAALKYHPETGEPDDASLRRVDPESPRWQWHVHLFEQGSGFVNIFSHYELRPDLGAVDDETLAERYERLREHYRPTWGMEQRDDVTYILGAACPVVDDLLE